ncbi:hypothetical protein DEO23_06990 [Brachybacterium endophyticum]|uniref:Activator of Hsp90 ATPase homologue 1/2-like C-terminal domain-containing protein n=1 Tax=Brachybacterium endophyticum TaxID=2182385 RepID=A0A2U2RLL7_9MICO|nr:SRPBCC domain-containing protein [Brachybacterium endophyticum]PWH06674.1 hypothetical protein DEO23_06990 [Brachybacterium endophyticum]
MTALAAASPVDAVRRTVDIVPCQDSVHLTMTLATIFAPAPARLWPLLTDPAQLVQWYGPVGGDLREGGRFTAPGAEGGILEVEAPHSLHLSWEYEGRRDDLLIRLDPVDDGSTDLELTHTTDVDAEVFSRFGPGALAVGWDLALLGLAAFSGGWQDLCGQVPQPAPQWLASDEGADYVRAWSIRWAAASTAAGTDPEQARAGEVATTAAYGGARTAEV